MLLFYTKFLNIHSGNTIVVSASSRLLLVDFNDVILLHLQSLRSLVIVDPSAVEEEPEGGDRDAHTLRVRLLQLPHLGGLLDSEVDFVGVLSDHLQLDVFSLLGHSSRWVV